MCIHVLEDLNLYLLVLGMYLFIMFVCNFENKCQLA